MHEHPTQALLDAYTIRQERGTIAEQKIVIVGDILHSRVARSNIYLLTKLGARVVLSGPPSGSSTLITSAPISANIMPHNGQA